MNPILTPERLASIGATMSDDGRFLRYKPGRDVVWTTEGEVPCIRWLCMLCLESFWVKGERVPDACPVCAATTYGEYQTARWCAR